MIDPNQITREKIEKRAGAMTEWLRENAPYIDGEQRHLDADTPERAYWHYGYVVALRDVLGLLDEADVS